MSAHLSFTLSTRAGIPTFFTHSGSPAPAILRFLKISSFPHLSSSFLTQVRYPFINLITFFVALIPISLLAALALLFQEKKKKSWPSWLNRVIYFTQSHIESTYSANCPGFKLSLCLETRAWLLQRGSGEEGVAPRVLHEMKVRRSRTDPALAGSLALA